jgi:glyoxylase-like metal-dependent hydrolase (beta-lactamase superfamily II)/rhodanese-related sulfurtransferase
MYFEQFYLACLAHASYMLGSEGVAVVVDPQRDVDLYLDEAARQGLRIAHVVETHLHADFVSGHRDLAARTGATIHIGARAGAAFPHHGVRDGDEISFGRCRLRFLETPGHTPESMCVLVTDLDRSSEPWAVLTGDTLFIGDVGRPDLSREFSPQQLAGMLYDSLHGKLLRLPDPLEVFPAHGAGSLCGRNISPERRSTIGAERARNYALRPMSRDEFIRLITTDLPPRPGYFALDAEINRAGAQPLAAMPPVPALSPEQVERLVSRHDGHAIVLDTRSAVSFGVGHLPGSIHIALSGQYASWAATLLGLASAVVLVTEDVEQVEEARTRLARVGIETVAGYLDGGVLAWERSGRKLAQVPQVSVVDLGRELRQRPGEIQVLDVRTTAELQGGHIAQARHKPLDQLALASDDAGRRRLAALLGDLDPAAPTAVHCKSGYRSSIAASLLERYGFENVMNVVGGFDAWLAQDLPVAGASEAPVCSS